MTSPISISDFLRRENVVPDVAAPSKSHLLRWLAERAAKAVGVKTEAALEALTNREALGSTGIGNGVAIPHAPVADVAAPFGLLVRLAEPVDFEAIDERAVDVVFLLLFPTESKATHLNALACIAKQLRSPEVLKRLRSASNPQQLYLAITDEPCRVNGALSAPDRS